MNYNSRPAQALFGVKAAQNLSGSWIAIGATEKQKARNQQS